MRALIVSIAIITVAFTSACKKKKKAGKEGSDDATECLQEPCYEPNDAVPAKQPGNNHPGGNGGVFPGVVTPNNPPAAKPSPTFRVSEGTTIATISVRAGSGSVQGVTRIDIRAMLGDKAPSNCSHGTLSHSATTKLHAVSYTDSSWPEEAKSYRACFYSGNKLTAEAVATSVMPRSFHTLFVSSETYTGDLRHSAHDHPNTFDSAKDGADYRCQYLAQKAGFSGNWAALITTGNGNERAHNHRIFGGIYNNKSQRQRAVTNRADLWSARSLAVDFNADEFGRPVEGSVWTGTSDSGAWLYSCGGFTSNSGSGTYGDANSVDASWLTSDSGSCGEARHLYCIDRVPDDIKVTSDSKLSVTAGADPATIDVDLILPEDANHIGEVRIYALDGNQDSARPLSCESPDFHEVLVRAYSADPSDLYEAPTSDAFTFQHASDGYYSHRMCVWDLYGNLISEHKEPAILTSGLPAEDYQYAFVLGGLTGDIGGLSGADDRCTDAAHAAGLTDQFPIWKALLSATGAPARDRMQINGKVYVVNGHQLYTPNGTELFSATGPRSGIKFTANGTFVSSMDTWTGSTIDGGIGPNHCRDWTSNSPDDRGTVGYADIHGTSNISAGQNRCYMTGGLICISHK